MLTYLSIYQYIYMYVCICICIYLSVYIYILYTHIYTHTPFAFVMFTLLGVSNISYLNPQLTTERSPQAIQVPTHSQKAEAKKQGLAPRECAPRADCGGSIGFPRARERPRLNVGALIIGIYKNLVSIICSLNN